MTVAEAADALARGELSATELLTSVLERLQATEPLVGAWAFVDPERALDDARRADDELANGVRRGPLHGIPFGIKDVIDTAGWPTEAGSRAYAGRVPRSDAATVRQLRSGGAVALGKTVTHELAYGQNAPTTRNPRDPARYPGGSSVGSGVAVAVGSAPAALGTDTGGSVRNPAAVNGIVGLRPTTGLVDCHGTMHLSPSLDQIGPITRDVTDCALVLSGMLTDRTWRRLSGLPAREALQTPMRRPRLGFDPSSWESAGVTREVDAAVRAALEQLERAGADVVEVTCPALEVSLPATVVICAVEATAQHFEVLRERAADLDPATRTLLELGLLASPAERELALAEARWLRHQLLTLMTGERLTALVGPTLPAAPPLLERFGTDLTRDAGAEDLSGALTLLAAANLCGLPGLSVPCGDVTTSPVGLHLLGMPYADIDLLRVGRLLEQGRPAQPHLEPVTR
jgi:Asp-tRNA(Asn)/Glu-tRNA(Gln) amidotransferase A subunit family amidase